MLGFSPPVQQWRQCTMSVKPLVRQLFHIHSLCILLRGLALQIIYFAISCFCTAPSPLNVIPHYPNPPHPTCFTQSTAASTSLGCTCPLSQLVQHHFSSELHCCILMLHAPAYQYVSNMCSTDAICMMLSSYCAVFNAGNHAIPCKARSDALTACI